MTHNFPAITGVGSYLPARKVRNEEIQGYRSANRMFRNFWQVQTRYFVDDKEGVVDMGRAAGGAALDMAGMDPLAIGAIIVGSSIVAEQQGRHCRSMFPRPAARIREEIGAENAVPFDVESGCSSFIVGLEMAVAYIKSGLFEKVLVITVDIMSRILDLSDPSAIIFGDGAGAAVVESVPDGFGYIHSRMFTDSAHYDLAGVKWRYPKKGDGPFKPYFYVDTNLKMAEFVPRIVPHAIEQVLTDKDMKPADIDIFVLHQPGRNLIEQWKSKLGITSERAPDIHPECACLSSSSVPVTLDRIVREGKLEKGQRFVLAGAGIGWTYGAHIWDWHGPAGREGA